MSSSRSLTVAIAGVGGIGGHILDYLVAEKKHHIVVLSRNVSSSHVTVIAALYSA